MAEFDVVFMDFFGTIADGDRHQVESTCGEIVRDHGLPLDAPGLAERWGRHFFATIDESNRDQFKSLYECELVSLSRTLLELQLDIDPTPYVEQLRRYWRNPPLHGEAKDAIERIPVPICVVSNVDREDLHCAIEARGLRFAATVCSEEARSYKPHAGIFHRAIETMNTSPARCLHVGDSLHSDVFGAQQVGIKAAWIERDGRISDIGEAVPDFRLRSLLDVITIFD